jgi:chemotaxis protein MotB
MMPPKHQKQEDNVDSWLMSYADMITLLLAFFVIFISISEPKTEKMQAITESMSGQFGTIDLATPFQGTYKTLLAVVEEKELLKDVAVERTEQGIRMELSSGSFFIPNSVDINPDQADALKQMVEAIKAIDFLDYRVSIEGHSSNIKPNEAMFASNWEFTALQAAKLARLFSAAGVEESRIKIVGYGDSRPKVPNADINGKAIDENRQRNERIEIVVERKL